MKEFLDMFKEDAEKLMDKWYQDLDDLMSSTLYSMSFIDGNMDEHYLELQNIMIEVIQERLAVTLNGED